MQNYLSPNDERFIAETDSKSIQNAVDAAEKGQIKTVRIPRVSKRSGKEEWLIDKAILLPSNITVVLDDCHLILEEGIYDNIFRNKNRYTEISTKPEGKQHGIRIIGEGNAILDGGKGNDLREGNSEKDGRPSIWFNNLISLHNVDNYVLYNFTCANLRWWGIMQSCCTNGRVENIHFESGELIPNQDGIDVRIGCSKIYINNITGQTGDDTVALSAFPANAESERDLVEGMEPDIHDITIRNVAANTNYSLVVLRNTDGAKMYRIFIENIRDVGGKYGPRSVVRIGENLYYKKRSSVLGETYDITVRGVYSRCRGTMFINASLKDSHISDVYAGGTSMSAISTFACDILIIRQNIVAESGVTMENVVFDNIHYNGTAGHCDEEWMNDPGKPFPGTALDFRRARKTDHFKNVVFRDVFTREGAELYMECEQLKLDVRN